MKPLIGPRRWFHPAIELLEDRLPVTTAPFLAAPIMSAIPDVLTAAEESCEVDTDFDAGQIEGDRPANSASFRMSMAEALRLTFTDDQGSRDFDESPVLNRGGESEPSRFADSITVPTGFSGLTPKLHVALNVFSANDLPQISTRVSSSAPISVYAGASSGGGGTAGGAPVSGPLANLPGAATAAGAAAPADFSAAFASAAFLAAQASADFPTSMEATHYAPEENAGGKGSGGGKPAPTNFDYFVTGTVDNLSQSLPVTSAGVALAGGGTDVDALFTWMAARANGVDASGFDTNGATSGDFLVLRATGTDAYNPYIDQLAPALNSVATLIVKNSVGANDPIVAQKISDAEAIFFAGGDQANYINFFKGTLMESALNNALARNVPIGGTSAGLAILSEFDYAALNGSILSSEALANPYDFRITLDTGFITPAESPANHALRYLENVVTDSHFQQRDRMGREMTFLARVDADYLPAGELPRGIAINEQTALLVEANGSAKVVGNPRARKDSATVRSVYFLEGATAAPNVLTTPLAYTTNVARVTAGEVAFSLAVWPGAEWQNVAASGVVTSVGNNNSIY